MVTNALHVRYMYLSTSILTRLHDTSQICLYMPVCTCAHVCEREGGEGGGGRERVYMCELVCVPMHT